VSGIGTLNAEQWDICPVETTRLFMERTSQLRAPLEEEHTFFLAYIDHEQHQPRSLSPVTVANWIVQVLKSAGIDTTKYKVHSMRSASSTKTLLQNAPITDVKTHANWSLKAHTFEDYYYKPYSNYTRSAAMVEKKILSS
jgi:hypothetical protein